MIQILILATLAIIAVILAPWLIGVAVALAALYGIYVVIAGALAGLILITALIWFLFSEVRKTNAEKKKTAPISGGRVACRNCQAEVSDKLKHCDNCGAKL